MFVDNELIFDMSLDNNNLLVENFTPSNTQQQPIERDVYKKLSKLKLYLYHKNKIIFKPSPAKQIIYGFNLSLVSFR